MARLGFHELNYTNEKKHNFFIMAYNQYQKMHFEALYRVKPAAKKKEYALYENGVAGAPGPYPLLVHLRNEKIKAGIPAYLLKIKPVK